LPWQLPEPETFQERTCKLAPSPGSKSKQNNNQPYLQLEKQKKKTKASLCESCHPMQATEKNKKLHLGKERPFSATHWKKNKMAKQKQQYLDESKGINNNNHHQSKKFYSHHKNKKG